ncbi:aldo/keto reductase [Longimicrobium sp.]|uniref:aldo/keto reductase n=1 Tax=Longimicrobium sp. TaxID=2029185 RepID=UPI0032C223C7
MVRIGASELEIFPLGLGGNTFGNTTDERASMEVLDAFMAAGGNFIDTADSYSYWKPGNQGGESETILGTWMRQRGNRGDVILATKVGGHPELKGLAPDTIARAADESLRRLGTDRIDLYYAHHDDPDVPVAEIATAFDELVRAGKVRYVAISNLAPERIDEWMRLSRENGLAVPVALQPQYSLVSRQKYETTFAPLAERHGLAVFPYFALASGFLTGKYRTQADLEGAARGGAVEPYLNADGLRVVDALQSIADARGAAIATVALAWVFAKPTITAPLASATRLPQLAELMAAPGLSLTADEVAALDRASQPFA